MFQYTKLLLGYIKMRIDIIVPNFDSSSDEVTLSAWYKAVGDTISKGEVIADAETATVACGITSSYDCILAKILIKEGEMISPGTKIAVIETDMAAVESVIREAQQEEMLENDKAIAEELKDEAQIAAEQEIQEQQEQLQHEFRMLKRDEMLRAIEPDNNQNDTKGYSLSVPLDDENNEENLNIIINETKYLTRLVNDVLDLSKLQAGAQKLEEKEFDLIMKVAEYVELKNSKGHYYGDNNVKLVQEDFEKMIEIAERCSAAFIHVRVDLYNIDGKIFFSEMTFYSEAGYGTFIPEEYDRKLGELIHLPDISPEGCHD